MALTPATKEKPADSGFGLEIVGDRQGVVRHCDIDEIVDPHRQHTEEDDQEKVVDDGRHNGAGQLINVQMPFYHIYN
jgi:hypothetical protein